MTVLDAYAVISYLRDEIAAGEVQAILRSQTLLSTVNQAEVLDQLVRVFGREPDDVEADLALLAESGMALSPLDTQCATMAGRLRARHYHRQGCAVSLADCAAAATALRAERPLATADPALAALMRAEAGRVAELPDRSGRLPLQAP